MSSPAFHRALAATARIACVASVAACGAAQFGPAIPETSASAGDSYDPTVGIDEEEYDDACFDVIEDIEVGDWDKSTASRKEKSCCESFMDDIGPDSWELPEGTSWQHVSACCWALSDMGERYVACTPWGPPSPPCMPSVGLVA